MLVGHKKEWSTDAYHNIDEPQKHAEWEKEVTGNLILYDSIYMKNTE